MLTGMVTSRPLLCVTRPAVAFDPHLDLPVADLFVVSIMLVSAISAEPALHLGPQGFVRRLHQDGLELVERETTKRRTLRGWRERALPLASLLPALLHPCVSGAEAAGALAWLRLAVSAPFTLIPWRWLP
jgi:hypothetical protein